MATPSPTIRGLTFTDFETLLGSQRDPDICGLIVAKLSVYGSAVITKDKTKRAIQQ